MTARLDFDDRAIREMVDRDHRPRELRVGIGGYLEAIRCTACHQDWPCKPIRDLRDWRVAERERFEAEFPAGEARKKARGST